MTYPVKECPECDGEGRIEVLNVYQSPTAIEPATHMEWCDTCRGTGEIERDWIPVEDELPPVGVKVLVVGLGDGAPDCTIQAGESTLLAEGDDREPPTWDDWVRVYEWASL